jgi:hypothetical protein
MFQIGKATTRFAHWSHQGWGFNDWNRWREQDGHLCRNNNDCNWLDRNLQVGGGGWGIIMPNLVIVV